MQRRPRDNDAQFGKWLITVLAATICGNKPATILTLIDTPFRPLSLWRKSGAAPARSSTRV